ncbi:hypothetical protein SAMN05444161_3933 [Rhizobiales bacterium GAS191]|jgi:Arc/MetJ-type ribon-helix-helix transcriptional regulator|nr:hypothetical protein SAMN05519103_03049 [Rhizobiales bacterium GAS113]SED75908.1 hypothetical protein SAMN05444161_3933 [Rhizobiales bacterium GAS191]SEE69954.1 hypothetical protein SAMN05519104_7112 [Rhizobiales bacterium GAS188]
MKKHLPSGSDRKPPMAGAERTISVRMNESDLRFIDRWIVQQPGLKLSRPDAVRQLIAEALARK